MGVNPRDGAFSPTLLREVGEALHGKMWVGPLAADLDVARRTVERWIAGEYNIPDGVWPELAERLHEHRMRLIEIEDKLPR